MWARQWPLPQGERCVSYIFSGIRLEYMRMPYPKFVAPAVLIGPFINLLNGYDLYYYYLINDLNFFGFFFLLSGSAIRSVIRSVILVRFRFCRRRTENNLEAQPLAEYRIASTSTTSSTLDVNSFNKNRLKTMFHGNSITGGVFNINLAPVKKHSDVISCSFSHE